MPYEELLKWIKFFESRPFGWREDQRTYMVLSALGYKGKPEDIFPSIAMLKKSEQKRKDLEDKDKISPSGVFIKRMLTAKGGDDSGWKPDWSVSNGEKYRKS